MANAVVKLLTRQAQISSIFFYLKYVFSKKSFLFKEKYHLLQSTLKRHREKI